MAGPQHKRKPFQGKNSYKDLREFKSKEIKRSLVHRARLRKNYFKLLDKEGIPHEREGEKSDENGENEGENASDEVLDDDKASPGRRKPLPLQDSLPKRMPRASPQATRKPLNFAERARIAKERKEQRRQEKLEQVQARRKTLERKSEERERKKQRLLKRTKTGQPLMGPRINNLLDKIRQNQ